MLQTRYRTVIFLLQDLVPGVGLEPTRLAAEVFETSVSTYSTTRAVTWC